MTTPADFDALYRAHAPAITASLARVLGARRLDVIEAGVQEAFVAAIEQWRDPAAVPAEPGAWLQTVARRKVVDALRRAAWFAPHGERELEALALEAPPPGDARGDGALLAMMFVCCHPALPVESALALALRTLCGFPIPALCRALYADEAALEKRLARARQTLRDEAVDLDLDAGTFAASDLEAREHAVLRTLYVLFLEGYSMHAGAQQIDVDLCRAAIRLSELLVTGRPTPRAHALHALILLQASRLAVRTDAAGELVPLDRQDRARWDRGLIARGLEHLDAAARGDALSPFHLEAGIAAAHALAPTYAATPWSTIVGLYDKLLALAPSPVIATQRAIAIGRADGPKAGLRALALVVGDGRLDDDPVLAAAIGQLEAARGDVRAARTAYRRALELAGTEPDPRKVALLILRDEGIDWNDERAQAMFARFVEWTAELSARGVLHGVEGLAREGKTVRRKGAALVVDGPYAEGREAVLGFVAVRVADLDEACRIASESPYGAFGGATEVRMTSAFPKPAQSK